MYQVLFVLKEIKLYFLLLCFNLINSLAGTVESQLISPGYRQDERLPREQRLKINCPRPRL